MVTRQAVAADFTADFNIVTPTGNSASDVVVTLEDNSASGCGSCHENRHDVITDFIEDR